MEESIFKRINPKVLIVIFIFFLVFVIILLISLISSPSEERGPGNLLTPTPVPLKIPPEAQVPTPVIQAPPGALVNRLGEVSFSPLNISIPEKVGLYTGKPSPISQAQATTISRSLGFTDVGKTIQTTNGVALSFSNQTATIVFYLEAGNIQYYLNSPQGTTRALNSQDTLIGIAQDSVNKFSPLSDGLILDLSGITYYAGTGDLIKAQDFNQADVYDVPFYRSVNGLRIYSQFGESSWANAWINKAGQLQRVVMNSPEVLSAEKEVELLTLDEAKQKILDGEGIISLYGEQEEVYLPSPERTILNKVDIGYFRDSANSVLYPIYVFTGTSFVNGGEQPIVVYLPAAR